MQWHNVSPRFMFMIPKTAGVYMITVENRVVYVGQAIDLKTRIQQHFLDSETNSNLRNVIRHYQVSVMFAEVEHVSELNRIESALYYQYRPQCNQIAPPRY